MRDCACVWPGGTRKHNTEKKKQGEKRGKKKQSEGKKTPIPGRVKKDLWEREFKAKRGKGGVSPTNGNSVPRTGGPKKF